jgi:adenosylcobinamide-GDP ribazoletransferase
VTKPRAATGFFDELREAAAFLTSFVPGKGAPSSRSMAMFPVIGVSLGLLTGGVWRLARRVLAPLPAAAIVTMTDAAFTGAIHLDGVADVADGMFAHVPMKTRLDIMNEPQIGAFGTVALTSALITRTSALASIQPSPLLLASLWGCSRGMMVIGSRTLPYARQGGLATPFLQSEGKTDGALYAGVAAVVGGAIVATRTHGRRGLFGVIAGVLAGSLVLVSAKRRLGGFTGDVLGAAGVVCETVGLLAIAKGSRR